MASDQNQDRLPVKHNHSDFQVQSETTAQAVMGLLPKAESIDADAKIEIARDEGYDPMAVELALAPPASSVSEKIRLLFMVIGAAILVIVFFPLNRFFKPATKDLGPMSIGGPTLEDSLSAEDVENFPYFKVLVEIDHLYFQEGKLTEAIHRAESALERVPDKDREIWKKVYYRYWELLSDAGKIHVLKTSTGAYLAAFPEDPFANYYFAQAFLAATDRIRSFSKDMKDTYRQEADGIIQQIDSACAALSARRMHPKARDEVSDLTALYQKMRLELARLNVFMWKLGGYEEDEHPDVAYRDKALNICDSAELSDLKGAKQLKAVIYTHILDRWHWFEGRQIIQGSEQKRKDFQNKLDTLEKELKDSGKL